jgi:hypothetical protein
MTTHFIADKLCQIPSNLLNGYRARSNASIVLRSRTYSRVPTRVGGVHAMLWSTDAFDNTWNFSGLIQSVSAGIRNHESVQAPATSHEVRLSKIEAWLESGGRSPNEQQTDTKTQYQDPVQCRCMPLPRNGLRTPRRWKSASTSTGRSQNQNRPAESAR